MRARPMLEKIDTLPGSKCKTSIEYRDSQGSLSKHASNVARHIVRTLGGVPVPGLFFLYESPEEFVEIAHNIGVGIFLNGQRRGGMANEDGKECGFDTLLRNPRADFGSDVVQTLAAG